MLLCDLFEKYVSDKWDWHDYGQFYGPMLQHKKDTAENVLEVGIKGGSSIAAWKEYFTKAMIVGIDNEKQDEIKDDRIICLYGNAYDTDFLDLNLVGIKWDVVIDDGSHYKEDQLVFLNYFYDKLNNGGILFIEDIGEIWEQGTQTYYTCDDTLNYLYDNFEGDSKYLTVIDRERSSRFRNHPRNDEHALMYYPEGS